MKVSVAPISFETLISSRCVITCRRMVLKTTQELVPLARNVETKCATLADNVIHGRSLVFLGAVLHQAGQLHEALCYLDQVRTMLKAMGNIPHLATACATISRVHYDEGRLQEALDAIEEAWKYAELTESPFIQANVSLAFGKVLFSANRDTKAWKHIEIALMRASYTGDRVYIARALEYMGYGYLRRGDYRNAYGAYEAVANGTVEAGLVERCEDNMARIEQKQGNPDTVVGFYRPGMDIDKTLFYPPIQASTSELPISGS